MEITSISYQHFYEKLVDHLAYEHFKTYYKKNYANPKVLYKNTPKFWTEIENFKKVGRKLYEIAYAHKYDFTARYLYDKKSDYQVGKTDVGKIDDGVLIECLTEMGYSVPQELVNKSFAKHDAVKAKILFQFFLEKEMADYYRDNETQFKVYDHDSKRVIESLFKTKKNSKRFIKPRGESDVEVKVSDEDVTQLYLKKKFKALIEDYFECINKKDYKAAFDFWHPNIRKQLWRDDPLLFSRKYYNTHELGLYFISDRIYERNDHVSFSIYYSAKIKSYSSKELEDILRRRENEYHYKVTDFNKSLRLVVEKAQKNNFPIEDQPLTGIFDFSVIEWMHELAANDQERLKAVFPNQRMVSFTRMADISFDRYPDGNLYLTEFEVNATSNITIFHLPGETPNHRNLPGLPDFY